MIATKRGATPSSAAVGEKCGQNVSTFMSNKLRYTVLSLRGLMQHSDSAAMREREREREVKRKDKEENTQRER